MSKIFEEIFEYVNNLEIIDSHEHLPYREEAREKNTDVLQEYLLHYFNSDLVSAGLNPLELQKVLDQNIPLLDRWDIVEPYWDYARYTGYGRALDISVKAIYDINEINRSTIVELNDKFQQSLNTGHFKKVLKDMSKIKISLLDTNLDDTKLDCDPSFFKSVYRLDDFVYPFSFNDIKKIELETGVRITSLDDWLEACEIKLERALKAGAVALKSGLAYFRTLKFERVTKSEAEECFNKIFNSAHMPEWRPNPLQIGKPFQDYMMHFILRMANKQNLTMQIHTGLHTGNGNHISNSDPTLLSNIFLEYPNVNFDIFHIGYPYQNVISVLAKNFPNVYIDMCWAHLISPTASIQALNEWIDSVPLNKIIGFGGDYQIIDAVYGHQYIARTNVSKSLTHKVEEGVFDIEQAQKIAKMFFYDNPVKLFKLESEL